VGELLQVLHVYILELGPSHTLLEIHQKAPGYSPAVSLLLDASRHCVFRGLRESGAS